MRLSELVAALKPDKSPDKSPGQGPDKVLEPEFPLVVGEGDPEITGMTQDSRLVLPGDLFLAVRGRNFDGWDFAEKAIGAGAVAVMAQAGANALGAHNTGGEATGGQAPSLGVPAILVGEPFGELASRAAGLIYGRPDKKLLMVGVTGTNGKSTTAYLLEDVLNAQGLPCGVIGTVNYRWPVVGQGETVDPAGPKGPALKVVPAPNTTPDGPELWRTLSQMVEDGAKAAVIEVSSHGLKLARLGDMVFDLAIFTNLSRDHLDFHTDMDDYFGQKRRLFTERLKTAAKKSVVGFDDQYGQRLLAELGQRAVGFGLEEGADYRAQNVSLGRAGVSFEFTAKRAKGPETGPPKEPPKGHGGRHRGEQGIITSPLLGAFNVLNLLGVLAAAAELGLDSAITEAALAKAKGAPGRLERVGRNDDYLVLVDYSHTPASVGAALESLRLLSPRKLICVFGCGGDRDRGKRPDMAERAGSEADLAILTSDNPRTEDPLAIMADAEEGFKKIGLAKAGPGSDKNLVAGKESGTYLAEPDRGRAIQLACQMMGPGDILLIAGKGHEDYQILGKVKIHFDDREVALAALKGLGKA
ncbi:MAG: UDP-N-acetylmuramoyl-L-alanyl-D-glutamate--2,6-diaminopimelate ligase [Deltaproteobacteria bacterium]|jgi:UDP-N-acetylmuramoyl-L-alanyl-D-glutamate--2,6-diaminopimelate ligase|nr:UDP-N-acetylmuramoyl-L-alanyl-D-glutamate--2,6-diaminopimelate ligase [Deltaproteobacteria bacterium]